MFSLTKSWGTFAEFPYVYSPQSAMWLKESSVPSFLCHGFGFQNDQRLQILESKRFKLYASKLFALLTNFDADTSVVS